MKIYGRRLAILVVYCFLFGTGGTVFPLAEELKRENDIAPERTFPDQSIPHRVIRYEDHLAPQWKNTWDLARQLYRDEKYPEALVQYEVLLARKDNIVEARWEYATILIQLNRWRQAAEQLERLLAFDPQNKQYLFSLAAVNLEAGQASRAAVLFRQLYDEAADHPEKMSAAAGLVRSLEQLGDRETMLPYLEQLVADNPDNPELLGRQATLLIALGHLDNAGAVLEKLERHRPEDTGVLAMKADLLERSGYPEHAAAYWGRIIASAPDNMTAHRALQCYYEQRENWKMSLKHLEAVLRETPDNVELLERAAELNMQIGRIDDALVYYDFCLAVRPGDAHVLNRKKEAQQKLARDLLVLVENDGGTKLWQDLVQVTADRPGIYREIAELLRRRGQTDELIDVLTLLYHENPQDDRTYRELTALLEQHSRREDLSDLLRRREQMGLEGH
ncbi:MAG TPA: tetratricopeptide repeat protein [Desulfobacteraceae bacterium]|nr:tetratricopeptide repeat protein [Desulfobacteraceae bacterium]